MNRQLTLDEFPRPAAGAWRAAAEESLDGAPFEKKLVGRTPEGVAVQPLYEPCAAPTGMPGFAPYRRGGSALPIPWDIAQEIPYGGAKFFNDALRNDLERGQNAVVLTVDKATRAGLDPDAAAAGEVAMCGLSVATIHDLERALDGIDLATTPVYIEGGSAGLELLALFAAYLRQHRKSLAHVRGALDHDPLGELVGDGALPLPLAAAFAQMALATRWAAKHMPAFRTIGIRAHAYHDAGGHAVHELAFAIATAIEYLRRLEERGVAVADAVPRCRFSFSVGPDFFMAIAKFRAARILWAKAATASGADAAAAKMVLHARTALWNRTFLDPHTNILRGSTEALAAAIGGCQSIHVGAFDEVVRVPDEFSRRIARNTQIILRDECNFERVLDPAGGSGLVEALTDELATRAWDLFRDVERAGGMAAALLAGMPQQRVDAAHAERAKAINGRRLALIGVNHYANPGEELPATGELGLAELQRRRAASIADYRVSPGHMKETAVLEQLAKMIEGDGTATVEAAIAAAGHGATLGELARTLRAAGGDRPAVGSLPVRRLAIPFERLRVAAERAGRRPAAFLVNMGPPAQHRARADFAAGFFRSGGFEIVDPRGFATPQEAVAAVGEYGAPVAVICSTDATYPELVPVLAAGLRALRPPPLVVLAGAPGDHEAAFTAAGVATYIHLRADCAATLGGILEKIGIRI